MLLLAVLVAKKIVDVETKQAHAKDCHSRFRGAVVCFAVMVCCKAQEELLI